MVEKTRVHTTDGKITGKTVTKGSGGWTTTTEYRNTGGGILGPHYKAVSRTVSRPDGKTETKTFR